MNIGYAGVVRSLVALLIPVLLFVCKARRDWKAWASVSLVCGIIPLLYALTQTFPALRLLDREIPLVNLMILVTYSFGVLYLFQDTRTGRKYSGKRNFVVAVVIASQAAACTLFFGLGSFALLLSGILTALIIKNVSRLVFRMAGRKRGILSG